METRTLKIAGMSCQSCVAHVKKELIKLGTVKEVLIGSVVVEIDPAVVTAEALKAAVAAAGYELASIT